MRTNKTRLLKAQNILFQQLDNENSTAKDIEEAQQEVKTNTSIIQQLDTAIAKQMSRLTVKRKTGLNKLLNNEFLRLRMNALILRERIMRRLIDQKFEMEKLERLARYERMCEWIYVLLIQYANPNIANREHVQMKHNVNRRKGAIDRQIRSFEKLRSQMQDHINRKRAPHGAEVPRSLQHVRLSQLDTDDDIWIDQALVEDCLEEECPAWLFHDPTKQGIRAMLELRCCKEETNRLGHEIRAMDQWLQMCIERLALACVKAASRYSQNLETRTKPLTIDRQSNCSPPAPVMTIQYQQGAKSMETPYNRRGPSCTSRGV